MDKVTAEEYQQNPGRYELVSGHEEAHQNYYEENPEAAYCQMVITPKLAKYRQGRANYLSNL